MLSHRDSSDAQTGPHLAGGGPFRPAAVCCEHTTLAHSAFLSFVAQDSPGLPCARPALDLDSAVSLGGPGS